MHFFPLEVSAHPELTSIDVFLIVGFVFACLFFTKTFQKSSCAGSTCDLILTSRTLTLPLFIGTLVSTWYGSIMGVSAISYKQGINSLITQGIFWYSTYVILGLLIIPKLFVQTQKGLPAFESLSDWLSYKIGPTAGKISAYFGLLDIIPTTYIISLGYCLQVLFGGNALVWSFVSGILVSLYTKFRTDRSSGLFGQCFQIFLMYFAIGGIAFFAIKQYGFFKPDLFENLPKYHLTWHGGESIWQILIWGIIALAALMDCNFYSIILSTKSEKIAKKGLFLSMACWMSFDILLFIGCLYARAYGDAVDPQTAYLNFGLTVVPPGMKGILACAFLSMITATLDSYLYGASKSACIHILPEKVYIWIKNPMWIHLAMIVIAILFGQMFSGNMKAMWKFFGSLNVTSLLMPMLWSMFSKKKIPEEDFVVVVLFAASVNACYQFYFKNAFQLEWETFYVGAFSSLLMIFVVSQLRSISALEHQLLNPGLYLNQKVKKMSKSGLPFFNWFPFW